MNNSITAMFKQLISVLESAIPILIIACGFYFLVKTKFLFIIRAGHVFKTTVLSLFSRGKNENAAVSKKDAVFTALSAAIGTGNIAGVAAAITVGGVGSIFWMWFSSFFGMMTSFAENALGVYYKGKNKKDEICGGPMYYLKKGLEKRKEFYKFSKILPKIYALIFLFCSFGIGNMAQINTVFECAQTVVGNHKGLKLILGITVAFLLGLAVIKGVGAIGKVAGVLVPVMSVMYIILTVTVIVLNIEKIPASFGLIFKSAFGIAPLSGGAFGIGIKKAVSVGFKRGIFSNEAGMGSSVIANTAAGIEEPAVQGMWGMFEVFFDTFVICSLTAFTILCSGVVDLSSGELLVSDTGSNLVVRAFSGVFGSLAGNFVAISTCLFAFSSVIGWAFYGIRVCEYLGKFTNVYKMLFIAAVIPGMYINLTSAYLVSDILNCIMIIINASGLIIMSDEVALITESYKVRKLKSIKKQKVPANPIRQR